LRRSPRPVASSGGRGKAYPSNEGIAVACKRGGLFKKRHENEEPRGKGKSKTGYSESSDSAGSQTKSQPQTFIQKTKKSKGTSRGVPLREDGEREAK